MNVVFKKIKQIKCQKCSLATHLSQICCYSDKTEMLGSSHSSHFSSRQCRPASWSTATPMTSDSTYLQSHYWHTSLNSDPLPDRNKIMDQTSFNRSMKKQTWIFFSPNPSEELSTTGSLFTTPLTSSSHLRHQGLVLDSCLFLEHHTNHITKNISFHLKKKKKNHQSQSTSPLVHHWNDTFTTLTFPNPSVKFRVHKALQPACFTKPASMTTSTVYQSLQCIPIRKHRMHFKILLTHKGLHNMASSQTCSTATLLSSDTSLHRVPRASPGAFFVSYPFLGPHTE